MQRSPAFQENRSNHESGSPIVPFRARAAANDMSTLWTSPAKAWDQKCLARNATPCITALLIQTCPPFFAMLACLRPQDFQDFRQKSCGKSSASLSGMLSWKKSSMGSVQNQGRTHSCDSEVGFLNAPAANQRSTLPQIWIDPPAGSRKMPISNEFHWF